ncbi:MAG: single-stranded-DNA-specific exonuclease RecJ [Oscillospiraceae bacterium]|jgi:single-stranded-DNA-specific exonuclease
MKKWLVNQPNDEKTQELLKKTDLKRLCAEILSSRNITENSELSEFFSEGELSDPFLLKDMYEAVEIISQSVESGALICIYGDYDCDGITATAILHNYLECAGANVIYYINEREEGYGMNCNAVRKLHGLGVSLIITVDNGISAHDEALLAKELGITLIITDHHQPSEMLPCAAAIVNPHRKDDFSPYKNLAGVGVALKLAAALDDGSYEAVLEQYADIAAIGTIADVVSLTGENRAIVKKGLRLMPVTENFGLAYLMEKSGVKPEKIDSVSVAFGLAPRINAAGRFGSPLTALKAFLCEDEEAQGCVDEMISLNNMRKKTEADIILEIQGLINENPQLLNERVLVLSGEGWHNGVIGIVSSKILDKFGKPNFIISIENGEARGSARSFSGFNIFECLSYAKDSCERFGGHACAGGFSLLSENIDEFKQKIYEYAKNVRFDISAVTLTADKILKAEDFSTDEVESLTLLEPFGEGNPKPVFAVVSARVDRIIPLSNGKHTRLELFCDGIKVTAVMFGVSTASLAVSQGEFADFMTTLEINEYNGKKSVSLIVKDYRKSGINQAKFFSAKAIYESFKRNEEIPAAIRSKIVPEREDLIRVYKCVSSFGSPQKADKIFSLIGGDTMNYCRMKFCLDIFCEQGILKYDYANDIVEFVPPVKKINLEESKILTELRCLLNGQ